MSRKWLPLLLFVAVACSKKANEPGTEETSEPSAVVASTTETTDDSGGRMATPIVDFSRPRAFPVGATNYWRFRS